MPYNYNALEPYIDERTVAIHHDKHQGKYVNNTLSLIKGTVLDGVSLETIIKTAYLTNYTELYNNAAQVYNHQFYWKSMAPSGGGVPTGKVLDMINKHLGNYTNFRTSFIDAGSTVFGSGW